MVKQNGRSGNEISGVDARHSAKNKKKMNKNMQRLGGRGLSLAAFANAKSINKDYNPSLIKKKKEFYRNAKFVKKYKRSVKQKEQQTDHVKTSLDQQEEQNNPVMDSRSEDENEAAKACSSNKKAKKTGKAGAYSLKELYEKKHEEEQKARTEREAFLQAKKEERHKAEARRKALREKMFKKTKSGQPVMKYRIEHLLETIKGSN